MYSEKHRMSWLLVIGIILGAGLFLCPVHVQAATLKELQDQLNKAEQDLAKYNDLQKQEKSKAQSFQQDIDRTQGQIQSVKKTILSLQGNISVKENDINTTSRDIEQKTNELNTLTQESNEALATFFELTVNNTETVMMADQGVTLSHYIDSTEYVQSLQDRIVANIERISGIKKELETTKGKLEKEKSELAAMKGEQEAKSAQLATAQKKNVSLLEKAKANQAQYAEMVKKLESDKHKIANEIYERRRRLSRKNNEIYASGTSGYPFSAIHDVDPWLFLTRECTSYAAWKWNVVYGRPFDNTRPGSGSAWNWPALARDQGYRVSSTPQATAIVSWDSGVIGEYGHVAIVEKVNGDGTIDVSEYNFVKYAYSYRKNVRYQDYGSARFITP